MAIGYRYFGFLSLGEGDGLRFTWLQVSRGWGLAAKVADYGGDGDGWSLYLLVLYGRIHLSLPFRSAPRTSSGFGPSWGFSWDWANSGHGFADDIHLNWGEACKIINMPWGWDWHRTSYLMADGATWLHDLRGHRDRPVGTTIGASFDHYKIMRDLAVWTDVRPYRYVLRSGVVQERTATIKVGEMEWRMRALRWLPWPRLVKRTIDVAFNDEVGERAGSWKGGTMGCSYDLRLQETPQEALERMERERKF